LWIDYALFSECRAGALFIFSTPILSNKCRAAMRWMRRLVAAFPLDGGSEKAATSRRTPAWHPWLLIK
jgi:hypothetical protein